MYELFEHTADLGIRIQAATVELLFAEAARGLFSIIVADLERVQLLAAKSYALASDDLEYLLFDWLNELLYTFETEKLVLADFQVRVDGASLQAVARGEAWDMSRHGTGNEVKAITYHGLLLQRRQDDWLAEIILDI